MLTPAFQQTIPTGNWMYLVVKSDLPAGFATLNVPQTALQFSPQEVAQQRADWISTWQRAVSR